MIGSGFGGFAAGIDLSAIDHRVQLLEKSNAPRGRARVLNVDGCTFDAGPTIVTLPFLPDKRETWLDAHWPLMLNCVYSRLLTEFDSTTLTTSITAQTPNASALRFCTSTPPPHLALHNPAWVRTDASPSACERSGNLGAVTLDVGL